MQAQGKWEAAPMYVLRPGPAFSDLARWHAAPLVRALTDRVRLSAYILDHLRKHNLTRTADAFASEAPDLPHDAPLIDAPQGFLAEWWAVFWDVLSARTRKQASEQAQMYLEIQRRNAMRRRSLDATNDQRPPMGPGRPAYPPTSRGPSATVSNPPQNGPPFNPNMPTNMPPGMAGRPPRIQVPQGTNWTNLPPSPRYVLTQVSPANQGPPPPFGNAPPHNTVPPPYSRPSDHPSYHPVGSMSPNPNDLFEAPSGRQWTPTTDHYTRGYSPQTVYNAPGNLRGGYPQQAPQPPRAGNGTFANLPPPSRASLANPGHMNAQTPPQGVMRLREIGNSGARKRPRHDENDKNALSHPGTPASNNVPDSDYMDTGAMSFSDGIGGAVSMGDGEIIDPNAMFSYMDDGSIGEAEHKLVTQSRELAHAGSKVLACALNYEGSILATVGREKDLFLWETATGKLKRLSAHTDSVCDVRFCHQRNTLLATCSDDGTARVWDLHGASSQPVAFLQAESAEGTNSVFTAVDFHPSDHTLIATTQSDSAVRLWSTKNVSAGGRAHFVAEVGAGIKQVRFSPRNDGRSPALLVAGFEAKVNVFEVHDSNVTYLHTLGAHEKTVHCVQWDREGKYVLSASEDAVNVWDPHQRTLLRTFSRSPTKFYSCTFHPDTSNVILVGSYQNLFQWDWTLDGAGARAVRGPQRIHEGIVGALATSTRAHQLASVSHDGAVKLWSTTA